MMERGISDLAPGADSLESDAVEQSCLCCLVHGSLCLQDHSGPDGVCSAWLQGHLRKSITVLLDKTREAGIAFHEIIE
jgi:hypothetical protein